jgi:hypothetical protein
MPVDLDITSNSDDDLMKEIRQALASPINVDTVNDMVNKVLRRLGNAANLRRLRIFGHGVEGIVSLGRFSRRPTSVDELTRSGDTARILMAGPSEPPQITNDRELQRLAGRFARGAYIELHSCNASQGAAGRRLIRGMCSLLRVSIKASPALQYAGGGMERPYDVAEWRNGAVSVRSVS